MLGLGLFWMDYSRISRTCGFSGRIRGSNIDIDKIQETWRLFSDLSAWFSLLAARGGSHLPLPRTVTSR